MSVSPRQGFTLIELLAAVVVLGVLGIIFAEMTTMTSRAIQLSNRSIDASAQAYLSFDRIGMDLAALVRRPDVDFLSQNPPAIIGGGNILLFVTGVGSAGVSVSATGLSSNRDISIVGYQIADDPDNGGRPCLLRAGLPLTWNSPSFMGMESSGAATGLPISFNDPTFPTSLLPNANATPSNLDILAPGIIRMVVAYQLYPDNLSVSLSDGSWSSPGGWGAGTPVANAQGQLVYSPPLKTVVPLTGGASANYIDLKRIASIMVGVVALDAISAKLATADQLAAIAGKFALPPDGQTPLRTWKSIADSLSTSGLNSVPLPIRQSVRVFEQSFLVTPYGTQGR